MGKAVRYPNSHGDLWSATTGADGELYVVSDDTYGFDRSCDSNTAVHRLTGKMPPDLQAETINPMKSFGALAEFKDADDGMWKTNSITCIDGILYMSVSRHAHQRKQRYFIQETWDSSIILSKDNGKTWSKTPRLGHAMFPGHTFSTPFFVEYGKNGKAGPHGSNKYVYAVSSDGGWNNGSSMTMGRVPRDRIARLNPRDWEFIHAFDEQGKPIWRKRHDTARHIFRDPGKTGMTGIHYIAPLRTYVMPQWHFSRFDDEKLRWKRTRLEFYTSEQPWGPWTKVQSQEFSEAWYNPCIPNKFISKDGKNFWLFLSGDFTDHTHTDAKGEFDGYYGLWMIPVRVN